MITSDNFVRTAEANHWIRSPAFQHAVAVLSVLSVIWLLATRRFVDFSDEGFYLTSAWLAYSDLGQLPVSNLLMNFGVLVGFPYLFAAHPPIVVFRMASMLTWYLAHFAFIWACLKSLKREASPWLLHILSASALFVFLIPMLSYQNLPFLFLMASCTLYLQSRLSRTLRNTSIFAVLAPVPLGLGLISSTAFLIPFVAGAGFVAGKMIVGRRYDWGILLGLAFALLLGLSVVHVKTIAHTQEILSFFNSEIVYTSGSRFAAKAEQIGGELGLCMLVCTLVSAIICIFGRIHRQRALWLSAGIWAAYSIIELVVANPVSCIATCDAFLLAFIKSGLVAGSVVLAKLLWLETDEASQRIGWCLALLLLLQAYLSIVSNAPVQYNIKYACPAAFLLFALSLCTEGVWPTPSSKTAALGLILGIICVPAAWIIGKSTYGRGSIAESTKVLPGPDFRFMRGDAQRRLTLVNLVDAYNSQGCKERYFASVDSLMLGYFIFRRRPPFPHAWVATRVSASRDPIALQSEGCILMQDRALPGTPEDARTMIDYLKLSADDTFAVHDVGENMYLIVFRRGDKARTLVH